MKAHEQLTAKDSAFHNAKQILFHYTQVLITELATLWGVSLGGSRSQDCLMINLLSRGETSLFLI